jgi:ankyrin repeat protein
LLIANDAKVNAKGYLGRTPLHDAAFHGCKDLAELLLEKGADIGAVTGSGLTPLAEASRHGHHEVIEMLHQCEANK